MREREREREREEAYEREIEEERKRERGRIWRLTLTITDLAAILHTAAILVCDEINKAPEPEHEERQALKDLGKGLDNLKSDIMAYEVLLGSMAMDYPLSLRQQYVMGSRSSSYAHTANNT